MLMLNDKSAYFSMKIALFLKLKYDFFCDYVLNTVNKHELTGEMTN